MTEADLNAEIDNLPDADEFAATVADVENAADEVIDKIEHEENDEWRKLSNQIIAPLSEMTAALASLQTSLIAATESTITNYQALMTRLSELEAMIKSLQIQPPASTSAAENPAAEVIEEPREPVTNQEPPEKRRKNWI